MSVSPEVLAEMARKVRALCKGHPAAKIAWPHRELHEIADELEALAKSQAA